MSIFSRFADIINSNINALLDKAEDPEKLIRMIIQEMEDTLVEARTASAKTIAQRKELLRKIKYLESEVLDWEQKATLAVTKNRDDLAKAALIEKSKASKAAADLNHQDNILCSSLDKLSVEIKQLQEKLQDARTRQNSLKMRHSTSHSRLKVKKTLFEANTANAVEKFEKFERKLDSMEAEIESFDVGKSSKLKEEIQNLESGELVDQELESLKAKFQPKSSS